MQDKDWTGKRAELGVVGAMQQHVYDELKD